MAYLGVEELAALGFKHLGTNVLISDKAAIYDPSEISIGDFSRIDDFCVISGKVNVGKYVHITPTCLVAGGREGIMLKDYATLAYGVKIFSQSDDYSGATMVNSLIPTKYKNEYYAKVTIKKHVIIGAGSTIFPGVVIEEGCAIGAMALVTSSTRSWGIYAGIPAKRIKERKKDILELEKQFNLEQR